MVAGLELLAAGTLFGTSIFQTVTRPEKTPSSYYRSILVVLGATGACALITFSNQDVTLTVVIASLVAMFSILLSSIHEIRSAHILFAAYLAILGLVIGEWGLFTYLSSHHSVSLQEAVRSFRTA